MPRLHGQSHSSLAPSTPVRPAHPVPTLAVRRLAVFGLFPVILGLGLTWLYAYIATVAGAYDNASPETQVGGRWLGGGVPVPAGLACPAVPTPPRHPARRRAQQRGIELFGPRVCQRPSASPCPPSLRRARDAAAPVRPRSKPARPGSPTQTTSSAWRPGSACPTQASGAPPSSPQPAC